MVLSKTLTVLMLFFAGICCDLRSAPVSFLEKAQLLAEKDINYWLDNPLCNQDSPSSVQPGIGVRDDTVGSLISEQMLWRLPGLDSLAHGFNIFRGNEEIYPIFQFCYPTTTTSAARVQDTFRGNVYAIPNEVFASALPQCTFSMTSEMFSSSSAMAKSYSEKSGVSASASAGGGAFGFSASFNFAYSEDQSVSMAEQLQQGSGGTLVQTSVECLTSRVQLAYNISSFHPSFVWDLYNAQNIEDMVEIMDRYGTHFYESAALGGKLTSVTTVSNSFIATNSESSVSQSSQYEFSASVSGWGFSASAGGGESQSSESQNSASSMFQESSTSSYIMSYGGAPGSFGPTSGDNADWGSWAKTVDLLPIPITYNVKRIQEIIPVTWMNKDKQSVSILWQDAEDSYYTAQATKILKKRFGSDNMYYITIKTGTTTSIDKAGPYGFRLLAESPLNPGVNVPTSFFYRNLPLNSTTKQKPFALQPFKFKRSDTFTYIHRQVDLGRELTKIRLCSAGEIAGTLISGNDLSAWGVTNILVEDVLRSKLYPVNDFKALSSAKTGCVEFPFGDLPNSLKVTFSIAGVTITKAKLQLQLFINGTMGSRYLFTDVKDLIPSPDGNLAVGSNTISLETELEGSMGVLRTMHVDILVGPSFDYAEGNISPFNFTIFGDTVKVEYTYANVRIPYSGQTKGRILAGIALPSTVTLSPSGLVDPATDKLLALQIRAAKIASKSQGLFGDVSNVRSMSNNNRLG